MKTITLKFTDTQSRQIEYYLRRKYNRDKRTPLDRLCKVAIFRAVCSYHYKVKRIAFENGYEKQAIAGNAYPVWKKVR